jgi:hypothetical protein
VIGALLAVLLVASTPQHIQVPARLQIEGTIGAADRALIELQVAADIEAVEGEFGMSFAKPPEIHVFATTESYGRGMTTVLGYPASTASWIAENSVAFFEPPLGIIAVNWAAVGDRRPVAAFRHELTHLLTLSACQPRCDLVPAWLNEGQGRLAEAYVPGVEWRKVRVRYEAASMAATATLFPLSALVTQNAWNSLTGWAGYYKYQQAARVTELLREDVGDAPIARIYERIRRGENISTAYASLTGRSFASFVDGLADRMRSGAAEPGIATLPVTPEGPGASYMLYGLTPSATVAVTIAGEVQMTDRIEVSPYGAVFQRLVNGLPRGTYRITAVEGATTVIATVVKTGPSSGPW